VVVEVEEDCLRASSSVSSCFILACKNFGVGKTESKNFSSACSFIVCVGCY
jgi:hypothetical protein